MPTVMISRPARLTVAAATVAGLLVAVPALSAAAAPTHTITVAATRSHHVTITRKTRPGWTRLRNTGALSVNLYRSLGANAAALVNDYNRADYVAVRRQFVYSAEVDPGHDGYFNLPRGTYYAVDAEHGTTKYAVSQIATLHVSGATLNASLPKHDTAHISSNYGLTIGKMSRSVGYVALQNVSTRAVDVAAVRIGPHVSKTALAKFVAHPSITGIATVSPDQFFGIGQVAGPRQTVVLPQFLSKGRWVIFSQAIEDRGLQKTHSGQARVFTLR